MWPNRTEGNKKYVESGINGKQIILWCLIFVYKLLDETIFHNLIHDCNISTCYRCTTNTYTRLFNQGLSLFNIIIQNISQEPYLLYKKSILYKIITAKYSKICIQITTSQRKCPFMTGHSSQVHQGEEWITVDSII